MYNSRDGQGVVNHYVDTGYGLTIDSISTNNAGYIRSWELATINKTYNGTNIDELLDLISKLNANLNTKSENCKDILVIYTDKLARAKGFLNNWITDTFGDIYFDIKNVRFMDITKWNNEVHTASDIATHAEFLHKSVFIPLNKHCITPSQITRTKLKRACKDENIKDIYPGTYLEEYIRKAYYGGIVMLKCPHLLIEGDLVELDRTSAYIYDLLIEKHCSTPLTRVDENTWSYYLDTPNVVSFGKYKIKYTSTNPLLNVFKNELGDDLELGKHKEAIIALNSIDLCTFKELANIEEIECYTLFESKLDYLPKGFRDTVAAEYIKKYKLSGRERELQKKILNSIYGDCLSTYKHDSKYKVYYNTPQWGILTASYARRNLLKLAKNVVGWIYSDTDSIYCDNCVETKIALDNYNSLIKAKVIDYCDKFGYELLPQLGEFKVECYITRFIAHAQKQYAFEKVDGEVIIKSSGCNIDPPKTKKNKDKLFHQKKLVGGTRTYNMYTTEHHEDTIDGIHYESDCSCYEKTIKIGSKEDYLYGSALIL